LRGYVQVLKSADAPRSEKRIALRFVAHLVGDIHQPLHAGFAEDRGNNSVDVRFNGRKTNLHTLWDTGLVELEDGTAVEVAVPIAPAVTEDDRKQWQEGAPEQWALEFLAVVRSQVCRLPVLGEISAKYTEAARLWFGLGWRKREQGWRGCWTTVSVAQYYTSLRLHSLNSGRVKTFLDNQWRIAVILLAW
jgi:hypothetical protein